MPTLPQGGQQGRIDRKQLDSLLFPETDEFPVRYVDIDTLGHVNNVAAIGMLQEARIRVMRGLRPSLRDLGGNSVVAGLVVDFAAELTFPGKVNIGTGILRVGTSSITFAQRLCQDGKPAVYGLTTMVFTGPAGKMPIPRELDEAIASVMLR